MNAFLSAVAWMSIQVALFSLLGSVAFLLLRRRGPSAAAIGASAVLALTVLLALLTISPWPRWQVAAADNSEIAVVRGSPDPAPSSTEGLLAFSVESGDLRSDVVAQSGDQPQLTTANWWQIMADFLSPPATEHLENETTSSAWPVWIAGVLAVGFAVGTVRLLLGYWAVIRLRRGARPIADRELLELAKQVAGEFGVPSPEVCETSLLRSAATIGWRRPQLLLPAEWKSWSTLERRIVLAHEMAHISRRDYLTVLIARVAAAIHFYQPLVLWLNRQLRVQQELAADSRAAIVAGSRQNYLLTLAEMALRTDGQTYPWAARAFLPGTGLLLKRIAWLKRRDGATDRSLSRTSRLALGTALIALAITVAGIRGPAADVGPSVAAAAEPDRPRINSDAGLIEEFALDEVQQSEDPGVVGQADTIAVKRHRTSDYIPADAKVIVAVSPKYFAEFPQAAKLLESIDRQAFKELFGTSISELEDVMQIKTTVERTNWDRTVLRAAKPYDWKRLLGTKAIPQPKEIRLGGKTYYVAGQRTHYDMGPCAYFPDDRTLVMATEEEMKRIVLGLDQKLGGLLVEGVYTAPAVIKVDMKFALGLLNYPETGDPILVSLLTMLGKVKELSLMADFSKSNLPDNKNVWLALHAVCDSEEGAKQVAATADAVRTLALNIAEVQEKQYREMVPNTDADKQQSILSTATLWKLATEVLRNAKIVKPDKQFVIAESRFSLPTETVAALLLPAVVANREAATRNASINNMKMLALAMHNYHDAYKKFPPPVVLGKDGKTRHSWRVAILPYLEDGNTVYEQYRFDEPWDSEHNKKLIDKMPAVFRDPHESPSSTTSSYYMVTGKGTFGGDETGRRMKNITDGTSKTIMLVEAKRDIPWTKPEDIEIDADPAKPLPKLGGHGIGFWLAAFADGSVRGISDAIDPKTLRALFTVGGGEPIDSLDPAPRQLQTLQPSPSSSGEKRIPIEFRRAEEQPGEGLTERVSKDTGKKVYLHQVPSVTNGDIAEAKVGLDNSGRPAVHITLTPAGAKKMEELTGNHLHKPLAIVVSGEVLLAPRVYDQLSEKAVITGNFTEDEARRLADGILGKTPPKASRK